jgi:hypothetical protein
MLLLLLLLLLLLRLCLPAGHAWPLTSEVPIGTPPTNSLRALNTVSLFMACT